MILKITRKQLRSNEDALIITDSTHKIHIYLSGPIEFIDNYQQQYEIIAEELYRLHDLCN